MQEILDKVIELMHGSWRFRRYALITAWVVAAVGWIAIFLMPDIYMGSSRVFVDTRTALKPVLQGLTLEQDVNAQLSMVRQSLLSGPQLESVAQEVGLLDMRTASPQRRARITNDLRNRVTLTVTVAAGQQEGAESPGSIYALQYTDPSRERALKVIEILQSRLIENTLGGKRSGSENAQRFLGAQIQEDEKRLRLAEDRLAAFKKQNVGLMPNEEGGYFQRLQANIDAVNKAQSSLAVALSRREELQRQLRGEAPMAAVTGSAPPQGGRPAGSGADSQSLIREAQARLDDLLLRFTDKHPDVIAAREALVQLKQRRETELESLRRGDPDALAASGASANPVYQSIQLQLNQTDVEIASLRRGLADHQNSVAELRKMLDTMPQVEAEFARLNRDYDVTKARYTSLVERLEKSRLGDEASSSGSVRFDVIEPPTAAFKPVSPPRALFILGILVVALALGAAVAFLLHQLRPVFTSTRSLMDFTGLRVLGAVSMAWLDQQQLKRYRSYWRYSALLFALFVVCVCVLQLSRMGVRLGAQVGA